MATALTLTALGPAACGGSSTPSGTISPSAYLYTVCGALVSWESQIRTSSLKEARIAARQARVQDRERGGPGGKPPPWARPAALAKSRGQLAAYDQQLAAITSQTLATLRRAGTPAVKNGAKISDSLVAVFAHSLAGLQTAAAQDARLPTSSAYAYAQAATKSSALMGASLDEARVKPTGAQTRKVAETIPSCRVLLGQ